ncbi:ribosomal-processing cysteine protease Prp [Jeotgalibacillus proteolyticus]|uniref:Ribosomal processing cysteine protease Prp n=1 Tax=Jeotgalibacillus proteolyticus TaxID=2082395 RepID=A0A2S5GER4_9BACL|nr:ribosomal-processing cysteine protease Prp [Jeotgalibacillus proteolyticus]PPA71537.1 ribosomal-processing cysteine protease Prp [Jeotgalibacillus proteolyticus]
MIHVIIEQDADERIKAFQMDGHADYDEAGKDLVCAGASAVSFGAVNAVFALTAVEPLIDQSSNGGFLRVDLPRDIDPADDQRVQLLLQGMIVSLQTIEQEYGQYIKITFK